MSGSNITGAGVFAYGCPPEPEAPPRAIPVVPWPQEPQTFGIFGPCPKCKRHCRAGECPFCYADSLSAKKRSEAIDHECSMHRIDGACALCHVLTQRDDALRDCADLAGAHEATMRERDTAIAERDALQRKLDGLLRDLDKATAGYR